MIDILNAQMAYFIELPIDYSHHDILLVHIYELIVHWNDLCGNGFEPILLGEPLEVRGV